MDRNERIDNTVNALQQAQKGFQQKIWTALPGIVESWNPAKNTAVVQPAIKAQLRSPDTGEWSDVTMPLCLDCPVVFPSGGGYFVTMPLTKGDEGLLVFASRCIDGWWQSGGVQAQAEYRMHDLSDGFFIPGLFSTPRVPSIRTDSMRIGDVTGDNFVDINTTTGEILIEAASRVTINTPLINILQQLVIADVNFATHVHNGVVHGNAVSGPPVVP